ncbi:MAG: VOC family protein [Elusimicrobia bacterium]|nr:VOC family protein [Elusimicrobiota bacterium]
MKGPALRHTGIVVTDLRRSLRFYRGLLGLRVWREETEAGPYLDSVVGLRGARVRWAKLKAPAGGMIELLQYLSHPRPARRQVRSQDVGASHIALTVRDADGLCRRLRRRGLKVNSAPAVSPDGRVKVAYAHDPDGTIVELVEELG